MGKSKKAKTVSNTGKFSSLSTHTLDLHLYNRVESKFYTEVTPPPQSILLRGPPVVPPGCSICEREVDEDGSVWRFCDGSPHARVEVLWSDRDGPAVIAVQPALFPAECRAWIEWGEATGFALEKHSQVDHIDCKEGRAYSSEYPAGTAVVLN